MKWNAHRWSCLVEALAFGGFVSVYIWKLQTEAPWTWSLMLIWLLVSFVIRRDTPKTMGWRADNLWPATKRAAWFFGISSLLICFGGLFLGMLHRLPEHLMDAKRFGGYFAFCLLQQVGLNSFLMNRLLAAFEKAEPAALVAGLVFGALHWPNPVLVPLTFIGGVAMAWLFAKDRNILPLTLGQALLGSLVWWAFPIAWHHSMRVGPGYREFRMKQ
ncbi:MAG TPA: CPBP family intramembrane glutamic endopeptidase [Candidatus Sulfotelmatobacter sp.]|nr:CPBP family intramembrane glutamic endopeptidase [Candidatus Sulfotelmatobacter sp.]